MSAPSIPNLLSLRGAGARRGQRDRGRAGGAGGGERGGGLRGPNSPSGQSDDLTIQGTDSDAAVSRLSAVNAGYLDDPYARYFVSTVDGPPARRFPIINRGTYARTTGIDSLVHSFLSANENSEGGRQIISLGAGTDTRPFRLFEARQHQNLIYHEIDFPVASSNKLRAIQSTPQLDAILPNRTQTTDAHHWTSRPSDDGSEYHSHGLDVRSLLLPASSTTSAETLPGLRTDVPTLLLSECCLCYLQPEESERVMAYFSSRMPDLAIVIYEPMHLGDPFSDTMTSNLAARGILMPGLGTYRSQKDQEARLRAAGFQAVRHMTVDRIWDAWVRQDEKERVDGLEGLDEVEEWKLLAGHYLVIWGSTGSARVLGNSLQS